MQMLIIILLKIEWNMLLFTDILHNCHFDYEQICIFRPLCLSYNILYILVTNDMWCMYTLLAKSSYTDFGLLQDRQNVQWNMPSLYFYQARSLDDH